MFQVFVRSEEIELDEEKSQRLKNVKDQFNRALSGLLVEFQATREKSDLRETKLLSLEKENEALRCKNAALEKSLHEMIFQRERIAVSSEAQQQAYKRQQQQVAKVLKKTLCKLNETRSHLELVQNDLNYFKLDEHDLIQKVFELKSDLGQAYQKIENLESKLWTANRSIKETFSLNEEDLAQRLAKALKFVLEELKTVRNNAE